jgi:alpha-beta hydrolase superfamily lysophospholipase
VVTPYPEIEFYRASDGRRLAVRVWRPNGPPRARVVLLHGITSHSGWYSGSCSHLAAAGCEVHFLDRRGSGLNCEQPGDVDRWETWIDDVAVYLAKCRTPDVWCHGIDGASSRQAGPILCGISWGGKLAVAVARRHPGLLDGLGLICPGLFSHHEPGLLKRLVLAIPQPTRFAQARVSIPLGDPGLFIEHPKWREFIERDPLALRKVTLRFARADRELARFAQRAAPYLHLPLLLMLAGRDRIVANRPTRKFFARAASSNKTLIEYSNATHTLEFETEPDAYFADLANWLTKTAGC